MEVFFRRVRQALGYPSVSPLVQVFRAANIRGDKATISGRSDTWNDAGKTQRKPTQSRSWMLIGPKAHHCCTHAHRPGPVQQTSLSRWAIWWRGGDDPAFNAVARPPPRSLRRAHADHEIKPRKGVQPPHGQTPAFRNAKQIRKTANNAPPGNRNQPCRASDLNSGRPRIDFRPRQRGPGARWIVAA